MWMSPRGDWESDEEKFRKKQAMLDVKNGINVKGGTGHLMKPGKNYSKRKKKKK